MWTSKTKLKRALALHYFLTLLTDATASDRGVNPFPAPGLRHLTGSLISFPRTPNSQWPGNPGHPVSRAWLSCPLYTTVQGTRAAFKIWDWGSKSDCPQTIRHQKDYLASLSLLSKSANRITSTCPYEETPRSLALDPDTYPKWSHCLLAAPCLQYRLINSKDIFFAAQQLMNVAWLLHVSPFPSNSS